MTKNGVWMYLGRQNIDSNKWGRVKDCLDSKSVEKSFIIGRQNLSDDSTHEKNREEECKTGCYLLCISSNVEISRR